jgi:prephenate dehydrogenase
VRPLWPERRSAPSDGQPADHAFARRAAGCSAGGQPLKVAVLGVGLIGGSIGLAARARAGAHVRGWDPDPDACARALELGAIDVSAPDLAGAVEGADVVFVAAPVGALVATVRDALDSAGAQTIVTDVGSTKRFVAEAISDPRFVGGHPLAGAEAAGVEHAREDLFEGAAWYLIPAGVAAPAGSVPQAEASAPRAHSGAAPDVSYEQLHRLIASFGAEPVAIGADAHDRLMATVSHLPHVLANLLVAQALASLGEDGRPNDRRLGTGPSFRDATRVAGSNSAIWTDIYMSNRDALMAAIDELTARLAQVRAALADGDAQALRDWNERARTDHEGLIGEIDRRH